MPVATAIRMNPFAVKILQIAVESVLERTGCRDWTVNAESGDVDARVTVEGHESQFLFRLKNPFFEVQVTQPHPALTREAAQQAAELLADGVMAFLDDEEWISALLAASKQTEKGEV